MTFAQPFTDYEILDRVGSGAMGTVFKARQKNLNRTVALKVLKPSLARNKRYVDRLRREAHIVASFNHENIVQGYDLGEEGGYHFFVMEFVEGRSLRELLSEWGSFPEAKVLDVGIKVTSALDHAYRKGVIHRDVKPGNILIDDDGRVKLTDMGLAKGPADLTITRDGATVGTPQYISPEQARDPQNVDVRSDLYSLGATLFHMVTGQPPFPAETMAKVIVKLLQEPAPAPRELDPDIDPGLDLVIRKLLTKDPGHRYQTPEELLQDLRRVQRDEAPAVEAGELERAEHGGAVRRSGVRLLVMSLVGVLVVGLAFGLWWWNGTSAREPVVAQKFDPDELRRSLVAQLKDKTACVKWRLLRQRMATATAEGRQVLSRAADEVEAEVLRDVDALIEQQVADAGPRAWVARQADWRDLRRRYVEEHLAQSLFTQLGVRQAELPESARQRFVKGQQRLVEKLEDQQRQIVQGYQTRHRRFLQDLPRKSKAFRSAMSIDDFATALEVWQQEVERFHRGGGLPSPDQLPASLRESLEQVERQARQEIREGVGKRQEQAVRSFSACLARLEDVRGLLGAAGQPANPKPAEDALESLRQELATTWPDSHFLPDKNPWPLARQQLAQVEAQVQRHRLAWQRHRLQDYLVWIYPSVRDGKAGRAAALLAAPTLAGSPLAAQHRQLLLSADGVRNRLLQALLGKDNRRTLRVRRRGQSSVGNLVITKLEGRFLLRMSGHAVDLADLDLATLERLAADRGFDRQSLSLRDRGGLALWYRLAGDRRQVQELLAKGELYEFVTLVGTEIIDKLKPERAPEDASQATLGEIVTAFKEEDWDTLQQQVVALRQQHPELARRREEDLRPMLAAASLAQHVRALGKRVPTGVELSHDVSAAEMLVRYGVKKMGAALDLPRGWQRADECVRGQLSGLDLPQAREHALVLATHLQGAAKVEARLRVRFPAEQAEARALLVYCHGVRFGLALTRDGRCAPMVLRDADLIHAKALRRTVQAAISGLFRRGKPLRLYPRADYELRMLVRHHGRRLRATFWIGDRKVASATVPQPPAILAEVRIVPLPVVEVLHLQVRGRPSL